MSTFISESIIPLFDGETVRTVVPGEPVLPSGFVWRKQEYRVDTLLSVWKEDGPCSHGSGEQYLRKHWYKLRMTDGREMEIYFERQARSSRQRKQRWWLFSISDVG